MRFHLGLLSFLCLTASTLFGQFTLTPSTLNFFTVTKGSPDSIAVTFTNTKTSGNIDVTGFKFFHPEAFSVREAPFSLGPGQSKTFYVHCNPYQNVRYLDWLMLETNTESTVPASFVFAQGKFAISYYDGTQNKWDEDLETTLKALLAFGYNDLGYNGARDEIFMHIDNKAYNGQGAAQNTLECVYTGTQAVGYTSRTDCQTNYNFNTEHTVPQSLFSSNQPMLSDIHHLWPSDANANSERGDNPFGIVTNPSWSVGGSKSNGSLFEPRDVSKGKIARAVLYFALRYQDYGNFIAPQQTLLRNWCATYLPDSIDRKRNDDIYALQQNRNPFVDYPEFLERITLLVGTGNRAPVPTAYLGDDSLVYNTPYPGSENGYFVLSNQGLDTLTFSNFVFSNTEFSLGTVSSFSIAPDSARKVYVRLTPTMTGLNYNETVTFSTTDPANPSMTVYLLGQSITVGRQEAWSIGPVLFPNPVEDQLKLTWETAILEPGDAILTDLSGKAILEVIVPEGSTEIGMEVAGLPRGCYLLTFNADGQRHTFKVMLR